MGKRRERRKAAMSSTGRRVKLDLFAEPSGDLGGSSAQDELEGGLDSKRSDGLPNSPSSSGRKPENPLLLLGQYSDDEEDNLSTGSHDHANRYTSSSKLIDQVDASLVDDCRDSDIPMEADQDEKINNDAHKDSCAAKVSPNIDGSYSEDRGTSISGNLGKEIEARPENRVGGTFDAQVVGDFSSDWKMILHEETNQYYYWNMQTGETSWEIPEVLGHLAEPVSGAMYAAAGGENMGGMPSNNHDLSSSSTFIVGGGAAVAFNHDGSLSGLSASQSKIVGEFGASGNEPVEGLENPWVVDVSQMTLSSMQNSMIFGKCESGIDYWSPLIEFGDSLLQKLKSLESSTNLPQDHGLILKCVLEVEIRLSDMRSLSSHGSSLHPFWVLCEEQLRRLESVINSKVGQLGKAPLNEDTKETNLSVAVEDGDLRTGVKDEIAPILTSNADGGSSAGVVALTGAANVGPCEDANTLPNESNVYSGEIDMDVDMEVDDATSEGHNVEFEKLGDGLAVSDNSAKQEGPTEPPILAPDDGSPIPPPPEEEWIPPPPPDSEQVPPPPPDEPDSSYHLLPPTEAVQPLPYTDQYNLSYQNSGYEIYGHSELASSNFYGHIEGQVVVPQGPVLYGDILNTYVDAASAVNNVEHVAYYNIQDGTGSLTGVAAVGSNQFQIQSAPSSYSNLTSTQIGAGHSSLLLHSGPELSDGHVKTGNGFAEVTCTTASMISAAVEAPAAKLVTDGISDLSTSGAAATETTLADVKVQSKAPRTKKRTVASTSSLRSNKKVSSLLDKWKAAKEELEEEEEEEDEATAALAALERKRKREIEEWHAQQIFSGEAKENANFQPLGGDWRERVKRKRAQANKDAASVTEELTKGSQQPELTELSRDLPSGWQVHTPPRIL
ncbi:hypothetical protein SAY86_006683 [Trapa natans]|uniref:WW domain-containing protein n=1 Tax=Trapa natans TaxID=22666 RepID=A0AAN7LCK8_TRANT|nr:hypothetical protein SAY86_006683 [Trapa natans]